MRNRVTLLFVLLSFAANAQNWALLNPAHKYNYSLGGTDTITSQIFVTHIDTLGVDSFRYELNTVADICDTCASIFTSNCSWAPDAAVAWIDQPQFLGWSVSSGGGSWWIEGRDTLQIWPATNIGATWTGPSQITASVFDAQQVSVLSALDSLKWIAFSTGDTIALSQQHGIFRFIDNMDLGGSGNELIGMEGSAIIGRHFPTMLDLFNYQPGDILQYLDETSGTDGICMYATNATVKYTVLSRTDTVGRIDYLLRTVRNFSMYGQALQWGADCSGYSTSVDTVPLKVFQDHWSSENFLGCSWLTDLWPDAFTRTSDQDFTWQYSAIIDARLNNSQKYVIEPRRPDAFSDPYVLCESMEDTLAWQASGQDQLFASYTEGTGLTLSRYFVFEHNGTRELMGSLLNGVQTGTISPDEIILGFVGVPPIDRIYLAPNPASDHLTILQEGNVPGEWRISNISGQVLNTGILSNAPRQDLDVSALPEGFYVLIIRTAEGTRSQRFVIAR